MTRRNSKRQEIVISSEAGDCPIVIPRRPQADEGIYFLKYFPITGISASGRSFFTM
jgi:hypothetical protein